MLTLTYICHSGFVLETDNTIMVFDYWMDHTHVMKRFLNTNKHMYVFASHFHEDHFTKEIFAWRDVYTRARLTYILSKDILRHNRAERHDADVWLAKGAEWEDERIKVVATGSNDSGVSWIVEVEGRKIFHAGDLCNWYARFLADGPADKIVYSEETGAYVNPTKEEKRFLGELKDIRKHTGSFDLVMFPVDGRVGNGYTLGARQFIERFKVGLFVPMHFLASGFESAWRAEPFCVEKGVPFWRIQKEGESIAMADGLGIRLSSEEDIPQMREVFAYARDFMARTGNPNQWAAGYPSEEQIRADIDCGSSYVVLRNKDIVATFVLRGGVDATYNNIYDGQWLNDKPYGTIHRVAGNGTAKGIFHIAMQMARRIYHDIRIDTHRDNKVMQHAIQKEGFRYCGIIHCWNGSERLAFQYTCG